MLARLMVALLTLALAIPAMAMPVCHPAEAAQSASAHAGHAMPAAPDFSREKPKKTNPQSDALCIGCIAPSTLHPPIIAAPLFNAGARVVAHVPTGAPLGKGPPATPPPRLRG